MGQPSVFPHGTTIYKPEKCFNGYTIVPLINDGVLLFDMNGNEIRRWNMHAMPPKLFKGGYVMGSSGNRHPDYGMQDGVNLIEIDYDGNIVWEFDKLEKIDDQGRDHRWMARSHHDFQREGNPVGYYVPGQEAKPLSGNTLILGHQTIHNPKISDKRLLDEIMYEVDWQGNIVWQWSINEHFDELGFDEAAKNVLFRDPNMRSSDGGVGDYLHVNCMSYLGPNKWYDAGDERFKPTNIIFDSREANILAILDKDTGKIVWRIGPDFNASPELKKLGWIIGQHHLHMIPRGLPGEGNLLVFDNGGWAGYGLPNPASPIGTKNATRDYSRIIEFDPTTLKVVWEVTPKDFGHAIPVDASKFYSPYVSSAQRLPNGNTLIDEGSDGRLIEITNEKEIVWEWISPYYSHTEPGQPKNNMIYRAYRYPYDYVPQEPVPEEVAIEPIDNPTYRVPGAGKLGAKKVIDVEGTLPYYADVALCVATDDEDDTINKEKVFDVDKDFFAPLTTANFGEAVLENQEKPVLVLFGAERCVHCKALHPVLEEALKEDFADDFIIHYVDVDAETKLAEQHKIAGIPVVAIFKDGKELQRFNGERDYDDVCDFLEDALK
ncbi:aryl-sulfate sulfotransferase [Pediococcus acidilactici]|uniref:aryl-sulfate sulfotransferase n=1 Tax=Pediococcus acidilactici TaxID=1254 RepID=UPI00105916D2|nr:aryl-sulfate sulfotransferase [Pediococcus acidilactici]KAF0516799.1 thioredoxin [Pediococcus acidilactici]MCT3035902.1 thioredoxin [Pediococcus acidilactici]QQC45070.1 aryl-sulfate sulfotransferase [Pediococcus acidilactici]